MAAMDGRDRRANRGVAGRRWARHALLIALVASAVARGGSVWELEQLWEDDIVAYVQRFTGDVDRQGTPIESKFLRYEQTGWYQKMYDLEREIASKKPVMVRRRVLMNVDELAKIHAEGEKEFRNEVKFQEEAITDLFRLSLKKRS